MIGLKRGMVQLYKHQREWKIEAESAISRLKDILGEVALDIQHVGSTSISYIKAKPIIDIVVAVDSFDRVMALASKLEQGGFYFRDENIKDQLLFASGSYYEGVGEDQTHFVHVVRADSEQWWDYINFRNYLNSHVKVAREYEALKVALALEYADGGRDHYFAGKNAYIKRLLVRARLWSYMGKIVEMKVDRPIGTVHSKYGKTVKYTVNYGYIPGTITGDGEEIDVYLLGVSNPLSPKKTYRVKIIGMVNRFNDEEDKLVAVVGNRQFTKWQIAERVGFVERYFSTEIESMYERSCGAVTYTLVSGEPYYLLIKSKKGTNCGFPKGHMEKDETERQTALREVMEETSLAVDIIGDFREETCYLISNGKQKTVVYFLGKCDNQTAGHNPGFEYNEYILLPFEDAMNCLTHQSAKRILKEADAYIREYEK